MAFESLDGVSTVEFVDSADPAKQALRVVSTNSELVREDAVSALGSKAKRYVVHRWEKA